MAVLPPSQFLFRLAAAAARETLPRFRTRLEVVNKLEDAFDPVTEADREAEKAIRAIIAAEYPDHAILGEEFGLTGEGPVRWVIDPVDGTRPFICGIPVWGTLIGLTVDGRAEMGLMSQPFTGETFWADREGAWGEGPGGRFPLRVRQIAALGEATLFSSAPELFRGALKDRFADLVAQVRLTRFGADCYAFAMLAAGQIDFCMEPRLQPYDIVALIPLVERAGGVVTRLDGGRAEEGGDVLASGSSRLHDEALRILNG